MDVCWDVEIAKLFVKRVPIAVAKRRRFDTGILIRVRIEQRADKTKFLYASLKLRQRALDRLACNLRQTSDPDELVRGTSVSGEK